MSNHKAEESREATRHLVDELARHPDTAILSDLMLQHPIMHYLTHPDAMARYQLALDRELKAVGYGNVNANNVIGPDPVAYRVDDGNRPLLFTDPQFMAPFAIQENMGPIDALFRASCSWDLPLHWLWSQKCNSIQIDPPTGQVVHRNMIVKAMTSVAKGMGYEQDAESSTTDHVQPTTIGSSTEMTWAERLRAARKDKGS